MEKIYLSDAGPKVSPAIYGFYRWDEVTRDVAATMDRVVSLCLHLGINTFDHAQWYGGYQCEALFGQVIRQKKLRREDLILFTKCGLRVPHASQPGVRIRHYNNSSKYVVQCVEASLRNLQTDYIDIFLLDHLDPISNLEETALALRRLKETGKIKHIGVANFSVFQHQLLASYLQLPIVTNHIELNLLNTTALDNGQLDYIKQRYMRPLASAPLAAGRITNGTDKKAVAVRIKLEHFAEKYNASFESVAVAWLVKLGALPLIGTMQDQRIQNIAAAFNIELDHQDWYELYQASNSG